MKESTQPVWSPTPQRVNDSEMAKFIENLSFTDSTEDLHLWSVTKPDKFWAAIWDQFGVMGDFAGVVFEPGKDISSTAWFPQSKVCYAENVLKNAPSNAVITIKEDATTQHWSNSELLKLVSIIKTFFEVFCFFASAEGIFLSAIAPFNSINEFSVSVFAGTFSPLISAVF